VEPSASEILSVWERGLRQSPGERALTLLALADQTLEEPRSLSAGRRDALLLDIRRRLFGDDVEGVVACADCAEPLDVTLSVTDLLADNRIDVPTSTFIELDGWRIAFRVPTAEDLASLRLVTDPREALSRLMQRCVIEADRDGIATDIDAIEPAVAEALNEALAAADPGGETVLAVVCPACGAPNRAIFDSPSFVWSETQVLARSTLLEVHDLASAYGWSEPEILALRPARRRFYLEAIDA
jgi:hypothetical protein